ncbi:flavin reductase family protein [Ruegeria sp. TM1040]|jgi:flavin reductase (DIM6/NTAB) family NADH-FMN oxidoreductase RutF|uniref:flavin reductase family protein n=1 Tax=Rhodobacterales TaxID=204455 RepID=UPI000046240C|nr:flavin reductase family protein [Ruegeria sp. TM1040]ABF64224.1 flavin reductase-like FMN-binding [Ruegeria sp. TM1040]MDF9302920.1 flavin reductase family protein [Tritonibacter mobilis]
MTLTSFTPGPDTQAEMRAALGCFATGVVVVTTQTERGPLAMTVNSFTSVSLTPPLVLWCPAVHSKRHDPFVGAKHFSIHVMAEDHMDAALHFARHGEAFDVHPWSRNTQNQPVLDDAMVRLDCAHHAAHPGGDHTILVGEVLNVSRRADLGPGLVFHQGKYGRFSD